MASDNNRTSPAPPPAPVSYPSYMPVLTLVENALNAGAAFLSLALMGRLLYFVAVRTHRLRVKSLARSMIFFLVFHAVFSALILPYYVYTVVAWRPPVPDYDPYVLFCLSLPIPVQVSASPIPTMFLAIERIMSMRVQWGNNDRLLTRLFVAICAFFALLTVVNISIQLNELPLDRSLVKGCLNFVCLAVGSRVYFSIWVKNTLETCNVLLTLCFIRMLHSYQKQSVGQRNAIKQEQMLNHRLIRIVIVVEICFNSIPIYINYAMQLNAPATFLRVLQITQYSVIALTLAATFLHFVVCVRAMRECRVSRKLYTLVLNRTITDIALLLVLLSAPTTLDTTGSPLAKLLRVAFFVVNLYAAAVTNASLAVLKLYSVARPLHFRDAVRPRTCVKIVAISWLSPFAALGLGAVLSAAAPKQYRHVVAAIVSRLLMSLPVDVYVLTLLIYGFTVFCIWRAQRSARQVLNERHRRKNTRDREQTRQRFRLPTIKLALHMANFALFNFPFVAMLSGVIIDFYLYDRLAVCLALSGGFIVYQLLNYLVGMCLILRILLDVLIGFGVNAELRRSLMAMAGRIAPKQSSLDVASSSRPPVTASTTAL